MKFKKKPVVIDAIHWIYGVTPEAYLREFCEGNLGAIRMSRHPGAVAEAEIGTLEDGVNLTVKHIATSVFPFRDLKLSQSYPPCRGLTVDFAMAQSAVAQSAVGAIGAIGLSEDNRMW